MKRSILLQTGRPAAFVDFVEELARHDCAVATVASADACKKQVEESPPALVVLDPASQEQARQDVIGIMRINALVLAAVVSDMPEEAFHDAMEGLGILASLPLAPTADDARRVLRLLEELGA